MIVGSISGGLRKICIKTHKVIFDYENICKCIHKFQICDGDNEMFMISGTFNSPSRMLLVNLGHGFILKDFGKIHESSIQTLFMSRDGKIVITSDVQGYCKEWSVKTKERASDVYKRIDGGVSVIIEI